ncbi:unnamed protein product, partial [Vitis vinifera]
MFCLLCFLSGFPNIFLTCFVFCLFVFFPFLVCILHDILKVHLYYLYVTFNFIFVVPMFWFYLATFLLIFVVVAGAWLGFWVVRKLVLTEDGSIDISTSHFVAWSIRSVAAVMILQSSLDPLLAAGALICGILVSGILRRVIRLRFFHHLYK